MNGRAVAIALLVVIAGGGVAFAAGVGPVFGSEDVDDGSFPTETPATGDGDVSSGAGASDGTDGSGSGDATTTPPFTFTIERIEECGETCRDVTTTLTNERDAPASDVTVYTRIYAGNGTDGDVVWEGRERVGDLDAAGSYTTTERIDLSMADALAVQRHDGRITVQTTVESANETVTFTRRRDVA